MSAPAGGAAAAGAGASPRRRPPLPDVALALALALVAAAASLAGAHHLGPAVRDPALTDVWFDGDIPRVAATLVDRWSAKHQRAEVHPLLPLLSLPGSALRRLAGARPEAVVTGVVTLVAALWPASLFALLRAAGCRRADAALFAALGLTSAGAALWLTVPETFGIGSLTVMWALVPAALAERRPVRDRWLVLGGALSLSATTTNWMAGLAAAASARGARRAALVSAASLGVVLALWPVQKRLVPTSGFFLGGPAGERRFTFRPSPGRVREVGAAFLLSSVAAPLPTLVPRSYSGGDPPREHHGLGLSVQRPGAEGRWWPGRVAAAGWLGLLALGAASLRGVARRGRFAYAVVGFALGQFALHAVYGKETVLYALDYLPALVVIAAFATLGRARPLALAAAAVVAVSAAANNVAVFERGAALVAAEATRVAGASGGAGP